MNHVMSFFRESVLANAWGLLAGLAVALLLRPVAQAGYISPTIAMPLSFGVFIGTSNAIRTRRRDPTVRVRHLLLTGIAAAALGGAVFAMLLALF
jgi:hypothetical protein